MYHTTHRTRYHDTLTEKIPIDPYHYLRADGDGNPSPLLEGADVLGQQLLGEDRVLPAGAEGPA